MGRSRGPGAMGLSQAWLRSHQCNAGIVLCCPGRMWLDPHFPVVSGETEARSREVTETVK